MKFTASEERRRTRDIALPRNHRRHVLQRPCAAAFHARYGDRKIEIEIASLRILAGSFPPRALGLLMEWASQHQSELREDWELSRQHATLKRIAPLE